MTDNDRKNPEESKTASRRPDTIALRMLREHSGLVRHQLAGRSGVSERRIGGLERGEQAIEEKDVRALLAAMDLPYEAWGETVEHVERLDWLRVRHLGQQGALSEGEPGEAPGGGSELPGWVLDLSGDLDVPGIQRELHRAARVAGRAKERETYDLTNLLLVMLARALDTR